MKVFHLADGDDSKITECRVVLIRHRDKAENIVSRVQYRVIFNEVKTVFRGEGPPSESTSGGLICK